MLGQPYLNGIELSKASIMRIVCVSELKKVNYLIKMILTSYILNTWFTFLFSFLQPFSGLNDVHNENKPAVLVTNARSSTYYIKCVGKFPRIKAINMFINYFKPINLF